MLCCNGADIDFVLVFPILFACWALFFESLFECILIPKNLPKTIPKRRPNPLKIDVKNMSFFNIVFFGFRPRFWKVLGLQDGAKSAALLAAPGVLNPTALYACLNILLFLPQGRPRSPKTQPHGGRNSACWGHVGVMLAHFAVSSRPSTTSCPSWSVLRRFFASCRVGGRSWLGCWRALGQFSLPFSKALR